MRNSDDDYYDDDDDDDDDDDETTEVRYGVWGLTLRIHLQKQAGLE
jgi:hypothetical protein